MPKIEIYTKNYCPYCTRAKDLLKIKGVDFTEFDVTDDSVREQEMRERSGQRTVPQIFIDDSPIGGCSDLFELDEKGKLCSLLGLPASC